MYNVHVCSLIKHAVSANQRAQMIYSVQSCTCTKGHKQQELKELKTSSLADAEQYTVPVLKVSQWKPPARV